VIGDRLGRRRAVIGSYRKRSMRQLKSKTRVGTVFGSVLLLASLISSDSLAYCLTADATPWSNTNTKTIALNTSFPSAMRTPLDVAIKQWNMTQSALVYATPVYTTGWQVYAFNGQLTSFTAAGLPDTLPGYASGAGASPWHSGGSLMLNSEFTWVNGSQNIPFKIADTATVVVHEVGHFNGLSHPTRCTDGVTADEAASVMTAINTGTRRYVNADDIAYQRWRY
jgi:hypothetical protein